MKKIILNIFIFGALVQTADAQSVGIIQPMLSNSYFTTETVVRNYNDTFNIISSCGEDPSAPTTNPIVWEYTDFFIRDNSTGSLARLFSLPVGYTVHDIRFVTLRKMSDTTQSSDFCCFCGTKRIYKGIYANHDGSYYYKIDSVGFAGFFSMDDAIEASNNPYVPSSATAKVREVEGTSELFRMTNYGEGRGYHVYEQTAFWDNAVLDIIGITNHTWGKRPCQTRTKFYPDFNGTVIWDNNLRFNPSSNEILCDITGTDDFVVTVSRYKTNKHDVFMRYSIKESYFYYGGRELSATINTINWNKLRLCYNNIDGVSGLLFSDSLRVCNMTNNDFAFTLGVDNTDVQGIHTYRFRINNGLLFQDGAYEKWSNNVVRELVYLPTNKYTAVLTSDAFNTNSTTIINKWNTNECYSSFQILYSSSYNQQSVAPYSIGAEYLSWGMISYSVNAPLFLMDYQIPFSGNSNCAYISEDKASSVSIETTASTLSLPIQKRYPFDSITYPTYYINFTVEAFDIERKCTDN